MERRQGTIYMRKETDKIGKGHWDRRAGLGQDRETKYDKEMTETSVENTTHNSGTRRSSSHLLFANRLIFYLRGGFVRSTIEFRVTVRRRR